MDVRERIIVERLLEIDSVQYLDAVAVALQQFPALNDDTALGVCDHKRGRVCLGCALHQVWFEPEAGLARARAADNQHIFVAGILGILGTVAHHQAFRLRQNDVVLKHRIDKGLDVLCRSP